MNGDQLTQVKDLNEALMLFFDGELIERYGGSNYPIAKSKSITKHQVQMLKTKLNNDVLFKWNDSKKGSK